MKLTAQRSASVQVFIKFDNEIPLTLKKTSSVRELRQQVCEIVGMGSSNLRLFFNGENLQDECTLDFLVDGDIIEAFKGCSDGGPPPKRNKIFNEDQIKEALNESSEDSDSGMNLSKDNQSKKETETINLNQTEPAGKASETKENIEETIDEADDKTSSASAVNMDQIKGSDLEETDDDLWLEDLREKNNNGELKGTGSLLKQLRFYLGLPSLAQAEKRIVKSLLERIDIHSEWEKEKIKNFPENKKKES